MGAAHWCRVRDASSDARSGAGVAAGVGDPLSALRAWPRREPLAAMWCSPDGHADASRFVVLARPREVRTFGQPADLAALRAILDAIDPRITKAPTTASPTAPTPPPITWLPGWIGWFAYDLGFVIEPASTLGRGGQPRSCRGATQPGPAIVLARCEDAWVFDRRTGEAWTVGRPPALEPAEAIGRAWTLTPMVPEIDQAGFERRVARIIELLREGDVYQVNLAHRLAGAFAGDAVGLWAEMVEAAEPWHGCFLSCDDAAGVRRVVASASPELLLHLDAKTGRAITRPMKGTRPADRAMELLESVKDRAELAMIVDLLRNDLGRVARLGSVRVEEPRSIEHHRGGNLVQATARIAASIPPTTTWADALLAMLPGGSVTGAPKVRAMQIIDELEPVRRGPYCGSMGALGDDGSLLLNIAIRTMLLEGAVGEGACGIDGGAARYSVGAGIVADSMPPAEWRETLDKAGLLARLVRTKGAASVRYCDGTPAHHG